MRQEIESFNEEFEVYMGQVCLNWYLSEECDSYHMYDHELGCDCSMGDSKLICEACYDYEYADIFKRYEAGEFDDDYHDNDFDDFDEYNLDEFDEFDEFDDLENYDPYIEDENFWSSEK